MINNLRIYSETSCIFRLIRLTNKFVRFLIKVYRKIALKVLQFFKGNPYILLIKFIIKMLVYRFLCLICKGDFVFIDNTALPTIVRDSKAISKIKMIMPKIESISRIHVYRDFRNSYFFRIAKKFDDILRDKPSQFFALFLISLIIANFYFVIIFRKSLDMKGIIIRVILLIVGFIMLKKRSWKGWLYNSSFYTLLKKFKK